MAPDDPDGVLSLDQTAAGRTRKDGAGMVAGDRTVARAKFPSRPPFPLPALPAAEPPDRRTIPAFSLASATGDS